MVISNRCIICLLIFCYLFSECLHSKNNVRKKAANPIWKNNKF